MIKISSFGRMKCVFICYFISSPAWQYRLTKYRRILGNNLHVVMIGYRLFGCNVTSPFENWEVLVPPSSRCCPSVSTQFLLILIAESVCWIFRNWRHSSSVRMWEKISCVSLLGFCCASCLPGCFFLRSMVVPGMFAIFFLRQTWRRRWGLQQYPGIVSRFLFRFRKF